MASTPILLPSLKGQMGDWAYYVVTMTFRDLVDRVKPIDQLTHEKRGMKTWLQRDLEPSRLNQIKEYLLTQPQRFFNSIVVGIYGGAPNWYPVEVSEGVLHRDVQLTERVKTAFGIVELSGDEQIFAIDGQHRVEGIRKLIGEDITSLPDDEITVMIVAHVTDDQGHKRSRRLFSTLNRYAKRVSEKDIIALSEDDSFALVVRRLLEEYPGFNDETICAYKSTNLPANDQTTFISVVGLYKVLIFLSQRTKKAVTAMKKGPPKDSEIESLSKVAVSFFDALKARFSPINEILTASKSEGVAGRYRTPEGGHLLLRPEMLIVFAETTAILMHRGFSIDEAVAALAKCPMQLEAEPWLHVKWNPARKIIVQKNLLLCRNILLHRADQSTAPSDYPLAEEIKKLLPTDTF